MQSASTTTSTTPGTNSCKVCEPGCTVCEKPCDAWYMCRECDVKRLREQTSGSKEIDAIIQKSQETANYYHTYWEWIEPKQFNDIKHLADGGFSSVYTATWIDGPRRIDYGSRTRAQNTVVVLKVPNVPDWSGDSGDNVTAEFLNEVS